MSRVRTRLALLDVSQTKVSKPHAVKLLGDVPYAAVKVVTV